MLLATYQTVLRSSLTHLLQGFEDCYSMMQMTTDFLIHVPSSLINVVTLHFPKLVIVGRKQLSQMQG